jgi:hypothetical protein
MALVADTSSSLGKRKRDGEAGKPAKRDRPTKVDPSYLKLPPVTEEERAGLRQILVANSASFGITVTVFTTMKNDCMGDTCCAP